MPCEVGGGLDLIAERAGAGQRDPEVSSSHDDSIQARSVGSREADGAHVDPCRHLRDFARTAIGDRYRFGGRRGRRSRLEPRGGGEKRLASDGESHAEVARSKATKSSRPTTARRLPRVVSIHKGSTRRVAPWCRRRSMIDTRVELTRRSHTLGQRRLRARLAATPWSEGQTRPHRGSASRRRNVMRTPSKATFRRKRERVSLQGSMSAFTVS
jgi:hypothetical protein